MTITNTLLIAAIMLMGISIHAQSMAISTAEVSDTVKKPLNPNGDTELALLMRAMYDDGLAIKSAFTEGEEPTSDLDLSNLYSLDAADPDKVASDQYKAYAQAYEAAHAAINNSEGEQKVEAYRAMVNSCTLCHQAMCPGPLVKIKKLAY